MKQWRLRVGVGLITVGALALVNPAASLAAQNPDDVPAPELNSVYPITPEQMQDYQSFAASEGISVDEVIQRFSGQHEFLAAVDQVRSAPGDVVVRAAWGNGSGSIHVKPGGANAAQAAAVTAGADMDVLVADLRGEVAQAAVVDQYAGTLQAAGQSGFQVSYDVFTNTVNVTTFSEPDAAAAESVLAAEASALLDAEVGTVNVVVAAADESQTPAPDARGGMGYAGCTGAFIVRQSTNYFISTARHCLTTPSTYDGASVSTSMSAIASGHDLRRTRLSGSHPATFRWSWGSYRTVKSYGNPTIGILACKFGVTTGNGCATVVGVDWCAVYENFPRFCGLAAMSGILTKPGDSGGPWFTGSKALGIHSGRSGASSVFTKIGLLPGLLGVTVVTG
ncbi:S1 family peptidase [Microbacterium flavescens]|uniref:S1 family peptidase n=1 Tax=Microbacterium flavescens TaxID=69366 RepID=UPI001BDF695B|nr:S1 family peptidase [Microbacterium flavescens]